MRVELVSFKPEYAALLYRWRQEPSTVVHNPLRAMDEAELARVLSLESSDLAEYGKREAFRWYVQADGQVVGNISLKNISTMMATGELGYGLAESHQGRGIATQALRLLVARLFAESPLRKLIAYVHVDNEPSCKLLDRLGFRREGLLREHFILNGKPVDEVLFGLLRREWRQGPGVGDAPGAWTK